MLNGTGNFDSLVSQLLKNPSAMQETWVGKIPWRRERLPTPVFLPGEFHGPRSPVGYSPWGCKEQDTAEQLTHTGIYIYIHTHIHTHTHTHTCHIIFMAT